MAEQAVILRPVRPISRLVAPFSRFARLEASGGLLLLVATAAALLSANSPLRAAYIGLLQLPIEIGLGPHTLAEPLQFWINDGCMTLFFLLVGLEIKRELLVGELASPRRALLPVLAALGGVLAPALLYLAMNRAHPAARGWGIPIATDIAFSLAILTLFGSRIPAGLKIFLAGFAIVDDIAGVLVIAVAYSQAIHLLMLFLATLCFLACLAANRAGVIRLRVYLAFGVLLWLALLRSGVHASLAGLILAVAVPARSFLSPQSFLDRGRVGLSEFESLTAPAAPTSDHHTVGKPLYHLRAGLELVESPLDRLQHALHPWVSYGIMPLFAFANAGIPLRGIRGPDLLQPSVLGIYLGLLLGKPVGITLFSWLAVRFRLAQLPHGVSWAELHAVSWLGGIGFTISIFIASLAFGYQPLYADARLAILLASASAAVIGSFMLWRIVCRQPRLQ